LRGSNEEDIRHNKNRDGTWRIRNNEEIVLLIKHADIVRYIKAHILRMDKQRTVKRITEWRPIAVRRIGRPRLRWEDDVRADLEKMRIQNWSKMARDREVWKRIVEHAKTHKVLQRQKKKKFLLVNNVMQSVIFILVVCVKTDNCCHNTMPRENSLGKEICNTRKPAYLSFKVLGESYFLEK
jgi:hypothetical protein